MEVLLDTNFIISCILKRIDFIDELNGMGFKIKVPREVLEELKDLRKGGKTSHAERTAINVAFEMLSKKEIKKMKLGEGKVDDRLIEKGKEGIYIATLDRVIKREVPNKVVIDNSKKGLGIERN